MEESCPLFQFLLPAFSIGASSLVCPCHDVPGRDGRHLTFPLHEKNITPTECQALSFILVTALKERVFVKVGTRHREVEDLLPKRWNRAWDGPLWLWVKCQRLSVSELLFSFFWYLTGSVTSNFARWGVGMSPSSKDRTGVLLHKR